MTTEPKYADGTEVPTHIDATTRAYLDGTDPVTGARVAAQDVTPAEAAADTAKKAPKAASGDESGADGKSDGKTAGGDGS